MYVGNSGTLAAAWSTTPVDGSSGGNDNGSGQGSPGIGGTVTIGSGPDTLALQVSEDASNGDAQFTVSIDGQQIGGIQTATASHSMGQTQTFNVMGSFAQGLHGAEVNFLNDGAPNSDRNLYVTGATIDNSVVPAATLTQNTQGPQHFHFIAPGGSGSPVSGDSVSVSQPANLSSGVQDILGSESDASQQVFLDWQTYGTPAPGDSGWVQATVHGSGHFFASVNIDHPGVPSTMFYRVGSGPAIAAWSDTPS
jgi:hypothetical protein